MKAWRQLEQHARQFVLESSFAGPVKLVQLGFAIGKPLEVGDELGRFDREGKTCGAFTIPSLQRFGCGGFIETRVELVGAEPGAIIRKPFLGGHSFWIKNALPLAVVVR